uniref:Uncharacterized protein n=1 Tax=Opuntia streptacantha TaxID=393608 RepID=A0A7C9E7Z4_OPUST
MKMRRSIVFMGSMMNVKEDLMSVYGRFSQTASTVCQLLQLLMKKYFACMVGCLLSCRTWHKLMNFKDQQKYQIVGFFVTCSGQILTLRMKVGQTVTEVFHVHLGLMWLLSS